MSPEELANIQGFTQAVHGIVLSFCWVLFADIILVITRYYKNWFRYILLHSFFTVINILSLFVTIIVIIPDSGYLFNKAGFYNMAVTARAHYIIGMIYMGIIVGIQILGLAVKKDIESIDIPPEVLQRKKKIHVMFGYSFYVAARAQVMLGWWVNSYAWTWQNTLIVIWTIIFFAFKFLYLERNYRNQNIKIYRSFLSHQEKSLKERSYETLVEMLENGISKQKIKGEFPTIKYCMYKNGVYDVTDLTHPGGAFIIEHIVGEEISRYIHGAYGLETAQQPAYKHTVYAEKLLNEMLVDKLDPGRFSLLIPKIGERLDVPTVWSLQKVTSIAKDTRLFYFESVRYRLNPQPKILYLGRHFIMNPVNSKLSPRLYTLTLCMSPIHQQHVRHMIKDLSSHEAEPLFPFPQEITELPFIIKEYKVGGFSQYLSNASLGSEIVIEGPFGRGLELDDGNFFAFCGGTGVLPLLDLVYEILLEVHRRVKTPRSGSRLPQQFRFTLYLSLNTAEDLNGLDLITNTYILCQKYTQNIFNLYLRVSKGAPVKSVPTYEGRMDKDKLSKIVQSNTIDCAFVCGSPDMNRTIGLALNELLGADKVHIM